MTDRTSGADDETPAPWVRFGSEYHVPVLVEAVVRGLIVDPEGTYLDATIGGGGHAAALLDALDPKGTLVGVDRDASALERVRTRLGAAIDDGRLHLLRGNFRGIGSLVRGAGWSDLDGVLLDLGVSTRQIDRAERGFSYRREGPLDMRMDRSRRLTAATVVNEYAEEELAELFFEYGDERRARKLARAIQEARPLETTDELATLIRTAVPEPEEVKTLSRVFQAIRIAVNEELEALEGGLRGATELVRPGGRCAVISYHSLEDRRVKRYFKYGNFEGRPRRDLYGNLIRPWRPLGDGVIRPTDAEIEANARARSARLRLAERRDQADDNPPAPG